MFHNPETSRTAFVTLEMSHEEIEARMRANHGFQGTVSGRAKLVRPNFCSVLPHDTELERRARLQHSDSVCPLVNPEAGRRLRVLGRRAVELR